MGCCNKTSNLCADPVNAVCVDYEGELGENTKITSDCVNQSEVNIDLYTILDEQIKASDLSGLGKACIKYPLIEGKVNLTSVVTQHEKEICLLKEGLQAIQSSGEMPIQGWGIDFKCLVTPCGDDIKTLKELLQSIINKTCEDE